MLRGTGLLGSPPEEAFDRLAGLARKVFKTPIAMVTLLDDTRLEAKSCAGPRHLASSPLKETFCQHVVRASEPLVVDDAREHELTKGLAIVKCGKALAYAGVPLKLHGYVIGTLCVADARPRAWTREDVGILEDLARCVLTEIALRADVEARKRAEAELERATERLRGLMDNSPTVIFGKDLEGRYLFLNRAGERALGVTEAEALGKADAQLHPPALAAALGAHDRSVIAGGGPAEIEETLELDGETVVHRSVKFPLTDTAGEPYGICAISTDVTERAAEAISAELQIVADSGELGSAKALLRRLETAVDAAQSALSSARHEGAAK
jgi:PAS domain S-box-containing protein